MRIHFLLRPRLNEFVINSNNNNNNNNGVFCIYNNGLIMYFLRGSDIAFIAIYVDYIMLCASTESVMISPQHWLTNFGVLTWKRSHSVLPCIFNYARPGTIHSDYLARYLQSVPLLWFTNKNLQGYMPCYRIGEIAYGSVPLLFVCIFSDAAMRIDVSYAVTLVARCMANPGMPQWEALVRIC